MTNKEIERINKIAYEMNKTLLFSYSKLAKRTGWSETTIRKYYDKNWYPGKYFQEPIQIKQYSDDLEYSGIYLLGQRVLNEDNEIINLIKIGQATNLKRRLNSYKGMNPFAVCIDTLRCHEEDLNELEHICHDFLGINNARYGKTEWFVCNDEQYQYWLDNKLHLFGA